MKINYHKDMKIALAVVLGSSLLIVGWVMPLGAHMTAAPGFMGGNVGMMEELEEQMMGPQQHERMEELMQKLLSSTLTQAEQQEMINLMRDENAGPGAMSMMMRVGRASSWGFGPGMTGMMGWGSSAFPVWFWLVGLSVLAWFVVGILLIVWLWKQIVGKTAS